jgi:hypothetical protein
VYVECMNRKQAGTCRWCGIELVRLSPDPMTAVFGGGVPTAWTDGYGDQFCSTSKGVHEADQATIRDADEPSA